MDYQKRRPPGDYQPKPDRREALPLRQHEDVANGAFSPEAEAKLFGREAAQSPATRSLRDDRRSKLGVSAGVPKAGRSGPLGGKSLSAEATQLIAASWRKRGPGPQLVERMPPAKPRKAASGCATVALAVVGAVGGIAAIAELVVGLS